MYLSSIFYLHHMYTYSMFLLICNKLMMLLQALVLHKLDTQKLRKKTWKSCNLHNQLFIRCSRTPVEDRTDSFSVQVCYCYHGNYVNYVYSQLCVWPSTILVNQWIHHNPEAYVNAEKLLINRVILSKHLLSDWSDRVEVCYKPVYSNNSCI